MSDIISTLKRLVQLGNTELSVEQRINHWLKIAKRILTLVNANPALAAATLHIDNDLPKDTQHLLLLALFGKLCRLNDHYLQHVLASLLASLWLSSKGTPSDQTANIIRFLRKHNLSIWLDIIKLQKAFRSDKPINYVADIRLNMVQRLCLLANVFATKTKKADYREVFTQIVLRLPAHHRHLIDHLSTYLMVCYLAQRFTQTAYRAR